MLTSFYVDSCSRALAILCDKNILEVMSDLSFYHRRDFSSSTSNTDANPQNHITAHHTKLYRIYLLHIKGMKPTINTSAVRYSRMAALYTAAVAPTRPWLVVRVFKWRWIRPTGNCITQLCYCQLPTNSMETIIHNAFIRHISHRQMCNALLLH